MMKESGAVHGVLNDWDHAHPTDVEESQRVVRTMFAYAQLV